MSLVLWYTGLSGSGKTTLANSLKQRLEKESKSTLVLDGDVVRHALHRHLGFSRKDIGENNRLIAELAKSNLGQFDFILVPIISPYKEDRKKVREILGQAFVELFINCPLEKCMERDVKGLYKKVAAGELSNMIGLSSSNPYEAPTNPDMEIRTDNSNVEKGVEKIIVFLKKRRAL
jgi:adenylylsulfate kinase